MVTDRINTLIRNLTYALSDAGLADAYSTDPNNKKTQFRLSFDINERFYINSLPILYDAESMADISSDCSNKDKRGNFVCIVFDDGTRLYLYKFGIEYEKHNKRYHNTYAVLAKLNYYYKTRVLKESVHPLIIVRRKVVAYCGKGDWVPIPDGVVSIGEYAFEGTNIKRVRMPGSLMEICNYAFWGCEKLESVLFDDDVDYIGNDMIDPDTEKTILIPARIKINIPKVFNAVQNLSFVQEEY